MKTTIVIKYFSYFKNTLSKRTKVNQQIYIYRLLSLLTLNRLIFNQKNTKITNVTKKVQKFQVLYAPYKNKSAQKHIKRKIYNYSITLEPENLYFKSLSFVFYLIKQLKKVETNLINIRSVTFCHKITIKDI